MEFWINKENKKYKSVGRGCAWGAVAYNITQELIQDGILNKPIARVARTEELDFVYYFTQQFHWYAYKETAFWRVRSPYLDPSWKPRFNASEVESMWKPSFIAPDVWEPATKKFKTSLDLTYNVLHHLLPEMTDYVASMTEERLIEEMRKCLITDGVLEYPIQLWGGKGYYFDEREIYSLDEGLQHFCYGPTRWDYTYRPYGIPGAKINIWKSAVLKFQLGMTLTECIEIFFNSTPEREFPYLERLIQRIENPIFERTADNQNENTFDRIRIFVGLPRYMFDTWDELKKAVVSNRDEIDQRVLEKIGHSRAFQKFGIPVNCLKVSEVVMTRSYELEYLFELK